MKVRSVTLKNFLPFIDERVDVPDGVTGIVGRWREDSARSNRAGKSAFLEAVNYALFGTSRAKKLNELVNRRAKKKEMFVEVEFDIDGEPFVVRRGVKSGKGYLEVTGLDGAKSRESSEYISEFVGISEKEFRLLNYVSQGDITSFMDMNSAQKKTYLTNWIEDPVWIEFENDAKRIHKEGVEEVSRLEGSIENLQSLAGETSIKEINKQRRELSNERRKLETGIDSLQERRGNLNRVVVELRQRVSEVSAAMKTIHGLNVARARVEKENEPETIRSQIETVARDYKKKERKRDGIETKLGKVKIDRIKKSCKESRFRLATIDDEIRRLKNDVAVCPILKEKCDRISKQSRDERIEKLRAEKPRLIKSIKGFEEREQRFDRLTKRVRDLSDEILELKETRGALESRLMSAEKRAEEIARIDNEFARVFKSFKVKSVDALETIGDETAEGIDAATRSIEELDDEIKSANSMLNHVVAQSVSLKERAANARRIRTRLKSEKEKLARAKMILNDVAFVKFMFSKNGIPAEVSKTLFVEIESDVNFILAQLETGLQMRISTARELNRLESSCPGCGFNYDAPKSPKKCPTCKMKRARATRDELNFEILEGDSASGFHLDSGGGKVLISLAVRLAIIRLLQRRMRNKCRFVVLDEIFGMLDERNRQRVFGLVTQTLESIGIEQIFVVSHSEIECENILEVTRERRFDSRLIWL